MISKNRDRFAAHDLMQRFFEGSVAQTVTEEAASVDHFSVDGTLIEAWASMKSVRPKDEPDDPTGGDSNRWVDWQGEKRSNETHASRTDGEARLARKGRGHEAILAHSLHALRENRNGLLLDLVVEEAAAQEIAISESNRIQMSRADQVAHMIQAHRHLVEVDSGNEVKFEDVLKYLGESLSRAREEHQK